MFAGKWLAWLMFWWLPGTGGTINPLYAFSIVEMGDANRIP
jgi:hypothetical protein